MTSVSARTCQLTCASRHWSRPERVPKWCSDFFQFSVHTYKGPDVSAEPGPGVNKHRPFQLRKQSRCSESDQTVRANKNLFTQQTHTCMHTHKKYIIGQHDPRTPEGKNWTYLAIAPKLITLLANATLYFHIWYTTQRLQCTNKSRISYFRFTVDSNCLTVIYACQAILVINCIYCSIAGYKHIHNWFWSQGSVTFLCKYLLSDQLKNMHV